MTDVDEVAVANADAAEAARAIEVASNYNPYEASFLEHEFEDYALMRKHCPVAHSNRMASAITAANGWVLTRYDQSCEFLQDHRRFSNQSSDEYPMRPWIPQAIDPPNQTAYRRILNPWFTVDAMRPLEPHLEEFANELVAAMLTKDSFDFVADFADPFPTKIFCELAGFPSEDYEQIMDWKNALMHPGDGHSRGREIARSIARDNGIDVIEGQELTLDQQLAVRGAVGGSIYGYLAGLIEKRRAEPRDDMISRLIAAEYEGERPLTQEELEDTIFLFYMAGLDTVASALGLIVQTFATNPAKRHEFIALMDDPVKLDAAVEELVRYHAIVLLPRRVTEATEFHGTSFAKDDSVTCPTMAANRDPDEFENPDELIFDRMPNRHIGFGLGAHRCIGIHLARRELRVALQTFHRACPDYTLDPAGTTEAFAGMKGLASLPLRKV